MKKTIYVLNQRQGETCDAAGKAMRDVFAVLAQKGARVIWSVPKGCSRYLKLLDLPYLFMFLLLRVGKGDVVFYSIPENYLKIRLLKLVRGIKKYTMLCFINDLNEFRYDGTPQGSGENPGNGKELSALMAADKILVPNQNTAEMLRKAGVASELIPVGIWDYLMTEEQSRALAQAQEKAQREKMARGAAPAGEPETADAPAAEQVRIAFAGNLNKSEFLSVMEVPAGISMELWGRLDEEKEKTLPSGCHYHGVLSSDEVPLAVCAMDYGLVWDGAGRDGIKGGLGEYLRYNNSHKCALYLASGIPVIVWSESGMARFVSEHGCGLMIERLGELEEKIKNADYKELKRRALAAAPKLRAGYYLGKALDAALNDQ